MCERYTIIAETDEISDRFNVEIGEDFNLTYNAAPSQVLPVITNKLPKEASFFHWGLVPGWAKNKSISTKIINTDLESIIAKPSFRNTLQQRRCLVIADGYYEWKKSFKKSKIPYRIVKKSKDIFAFAGLWEEYEDNEGQMVRTFTIITTAASEELSKIHERMPVILPDQEAEKLWLSNHSSTEQLLDLLTQDKDEAMDFYTISPLVNNIQNNDPKLIQPTPPVDQYGNLTLFD